MSVVTIGPKRKQPPAEEPEAIPEGKYRCTKCGRLHSEDSEIGKAHLEYAEKTEESGEGEGEPGAGEEGGESGEPEAGEEGGEES